MDAIALYVHHLFVLSECMNTIASIKANLISNQMSGCCSSLRKIGWKEGGFPDKQYRLSAMLSEDFINRSEVRQANTSLPLHVTNMLIKED
jgi:hypothetical protein